MVNKKTDNSYKPYTLAYFFNKEKEKMKIIITAIVTINSVH